MALPKITHPVFKITIPSTKKVVSFRPYTVREEKLFVMMQSSKEIEDAIDVIKQIINNCCVDEIDVNDLALFDIEYIFVKLRSKSVGETIEVLYQEGDEKLKFEVNLENVEVKFNKDHKTKFNLFENIGVSMKYPSFSFMVKLYDLILADNLTDEFVFDLFIDCIEYVFDDEQVYKDFTKEELSAFILNLPSSTVEIVKQFFETMPVLEHVATVKKKDGSTKQVVLRGVKDFFTF